jgi:mannose-6-phosphate isomerase
MLLKLQPAFKDYIWGGTRLKTDYKFDTNLEKVAEGWMLSCHKDGENLVTNGKYKGKTLSEVIEAEGRDVLGENGKKFDFFPILIKLIDAKDNLSVQVHPDNDYALRVEGEYGKTECWYVLDCDEGAELIYGFKKEISSDEFKKRVEDNTFLDVVNKVKVHKGDFFFIEAGTLHAIGKGILICEIQQNSNTTYRVYDYGRRDKDGNTRPLHTEKAIAVTKCEKPKYDIKPMGKEIRFDGATKQKLVGCDLFSVEKISINKDFSFDCDKSSFVSVIVLDGDGEIICGEEKMPLKKGDSVFISAGSGKTFLKGNLNIIKTTV